MARDDMQEDAIVLDKRYGAPPKITIPEGYRNEEDFLSSMRDVYGLDLGADLQNRNAAVEDAAFAAGNQWDDLAKAQRTAARKPVLTINAWPAFIGQLVGNRRLNETTINVVPDRGGTKEIARIRKGLIRSILKNTTAAQAFDNAFQNQVIGGIGNFQLRIDWAADDVFEQDIEVRMIPNPLAVVWDRTAVEPTGADAAHCFVIDTISANQFKAQWPDARASDFATDSAFDGASQSAYASGWFSQDMVRVVNYWRMCKEKRTLALVNSGDVIDVTDLDPAKWVDNVVVNTKTGQPIVREADRRYAEMYVCTGTDILEGPFRYNISRLPVFRVTGWEVNVGEDRERWGLVRFGKDPSRLRNYWRSTIAERLQLAPKARWVASDAAVEGRESEWRNAHRSDDPLLVYNADSGQPPVLTPPVQMEPALMQEAQMAMQDIRDVTNIHEASLGMQSNEVSGKAIKSRLAVSELGSVIYNDNLNLAIEQCGGVINELIPSVYGTARVVLILGDEMTPELIAINDTEENDITVGKYAITMTTGPSYVTKRMEAAEGMMNLINAAPQVMGVAADLLVEAQDWPGADQIANRLKTQLPPGLIDPSDMTPQQKQALQAQQQEQAKQQQIQDAMIQAELGEKQAKTLEAQAKARLAVAQAELAEAQAQKALADAGLAVVKTELAPHELALQADQQQHQHQQDVQGREHEERQAHFDNRMRAIDVAHPAPDTKRQPLPKIDAKAP